jgi:hypothetical protein
MKKSRLQELAGLSENKGNIKEAQVYELDRAVKDKAAYRRFIDAIDILLRDWYEAGFTKDDVVEYMGKILPEEL